MPRAAAKGTGTAWPDPEPEYAPAVGFPGEDDYEPGSWQDADALLSPSIPAAAFPEVGDSVTGFVTSVAVSQQTDINGVPRTFENGDIRMQVVATIQTTEHEDDDDDGQRKLYIKGGMVKQFRAEMRRVRAPGLRAGGQLTVTYTGDGTATKPGLNPPKQYSVVYVPPARG